MPEMFFKLNNHDKKTDGFVAYYANPQAINPILGVDYSSEIDTILTISAKQSQIQSFQQCAVGDMIVIYQTIKGVSRVVTHVLEVQDTQLNFNQNAPAPWQYFLSTTVKARLNPQILRKPLDYPNYDLEANYTPNHQVKIYDLGIIQNKWTQSGRLNLVFQNTTLNSNLIRQHINQANGFELSGTWNNWLQGF